MPTKPISHAKRRGRPPANANKHTYQRYEREVRSQDPALLLAKETRSSAQWQKVREMRLRRNPVCQDPFGIHAREGRPVPAVEVDHIVSIIAAPSRRFDLSNTQALCRKCHARKTGQERSERRQEVKALVQPIDETKQGETVENMNKNDGAETGGAG